MSNETPEKKKIAVQFFATEDEVCAMKHISKVDAIGPAALAIVRKAIEDHHLEENRLAQPAK